MSLEIVTLATLSDNYNFLIHDTETGQTALVDAPEDPSIAEALKARGWGLDIILLTHHHWDHIDGASALRAEFGCKILGAEADAHRLPDLDIVVRPGESFDLFWRSVDVIDVPGHTIGHVAFYMASENALFSADSLMALGCGRLFEGTPAQMFASLSKLAALPENTMVYSGHEYTAANAKFALTIEPGNLALKQRVEAIEKARNANNPTVPSRLSEELATNPFLRSASPEVQATVGLSGAELVDVFTEVRRRKDNF